MENIGLGHTQKYITQPFPNTINVPNKVLTQLRKALFRIFSLAPQDFHIIVTLCLLSWEKLPQFIFFWICYLNRCSMFSHSLRFVLIDLFNLLLLIKLLLFSQHFFWLSLMSYVTHMWANLSCKMRYLRMDCFYFLEMLLTSKRELLQNLMMLLRWKCI